MKRSPYSAWLGAGMDAWALGIESSAVIGLRVARMATGGAGASEEARRMVTEKMQAAFELQIAAMTGQLGTTPLSGTKKLVRHYRGKVKANCRRLG